MMTKEGFRFVVKLTNTISCTSSSLNPRSFLGLINGESRAKQMRMIWAILVALPMLPPSKRLLVFQSRSDSRWKHHK